MPRLRARCHTAHSQNSAVDQAEMDGGRVKARQPRVPEYSVATMSVNKYGPVIRAIAAFYGRPGGADGSGVDRARAS